MPGRLQAFKKWLVTLKFPQGEEASSPWFGGHQQFGFWSFGATLLNLPSQPPWQPLVILSMSSPVGPPLGWLPLLLIAWEVCCRSNPSSTLPHDLGQDGQGRKQLKHINALKGKCPSPTWFPYLPSVIGMASDSVHQALSHCYSVHPKLSTHCLRLYLYQSFILTLQDNLARILLHRVRGVQSLHPAH